MLQWGIHRHTKELLLHNTEENLNIRAFESPCPTATSSVRPETLNPKLGAQGSGFRVWGFEGAFH